ncbi:O-antigen ligase family protein [Methylovulum psychrotolerans]|uniref:Lipid A core--O-antigen ligase n=1 Tax=Methylovulum psychrotolerans TaxID=1704499 RepID=A0A1Z4C2D2_9GAMM|nr:O-antigen ligase family protein [Methylovulum psychrotolerans]ASF47698.1 lipid A core--O-antigen ligase [Methylovulum psychrotolerans]
MQTSLITKSTSLLLALFIIAIYFSTSLVTILSVLLGLLWLFSGRFKTLPTIVRRCPIAAWAVGLWACLWLGLVYSRAPLPDGLAMVNKYNELFFIPVLLAFLDDSHARAWLWKGFIVASLAALLCSYLMAMGVLPLNEQGDPCFKSRITYSIFMAFFTFYCAHQAHQNKGGRLLYLSVGLLCGYNLFFIVQGRTGQLVLVALALLFAWQRFHRLGRVVAVVVLAVSLGVFVGYSDKAKRLQEGIENTRAYLKPQPEQVDSTLNLRYGFWQNSLKLMAEKPLLGFGTGSFNQEYRRVVADPRLWTSNPHNEPLMIGVQLGLVGVLVYAGFLWSQFSCARQLPIPDRCLAQGLSLALVVASIFNSPMLDHGEGHWFAVLIALCFAPLYGTAQANTPA